MTEAQEQGIELVWRLSDILAGNASIDSGEAFIAEDVDMHMDRYPFKGISGWKSWLRFIRSRPRVVDLDLVERKVEVEGDRIRLTGRWAGYINGTYQVSDYRGGASYRVEDGKIVEIWTVRKNYPFMFGPIIKYHLGWLVVLVQLFFWSTFYQPRVDWSKRLPVRQAEAPSVAEA